MPPQEPTSGARELRPPGWKEGDPVILWTKPGDPTAEDLKYLESKLGLKKGAISTPGAKPSILKRMLTAVEQPVERGFSAGPTAGATIGGAVGARYGMPRVGTAVGAVAGQGYQDLVTRAKEIPGAMADIYRNVVGTPSAGGAPGKWQTSGRPIGATLKGAAAGVGEGLVNLAGAATAQTASGELGTQTLGRLQARYGPKLSKWLMRTATRDVAQRILNDFPSLRNDLIDRALTISGGGYDKAAALLARWKSEADRLLQIAERSGLTIPVKMDWDQFTLFKNALIANLKEKGNLLPTTGAVTPLMSRIPAAARQTLLRAARAAGHNQIINLTPTEADLFKSELQAFVRKTGFYQRATEITKGRPITNVMTESMDQAAKDVNAWIERVATGYQKANREAQAAMGAQRAIKSELRAVERKGFRTPIIRGGVLAAKALGTAAGAGAGYGVGGPAGAAIGTGIGIGVGIEVGSVLQLLDNPHALSLGAVLLKRPDVQTVISQLPVHLATLLIKVMRQGRDAAPEDLQKIKSVLEASQEASGAGGSAGGPGPEPTAPASAPAPAAPIPRQAGGPVASGQPYLVGERGPEIIVPAESGTVVPNPDQEAGDGDAPQIDAVLRALAQQGLPASLLAHPLFRRLVQALAPSRQKGRKKKTQEGKKPQEDQETAPSSAGPSGQEISPWVRSLIQMLAPGGVVTPRQGGGPLIPGQAYLVGEQGPETIWPGDIRLPPDPRPVPSHESTRPRPKQPMPGPRFEGPRPPTWWETLAADPTFQAALASSEGLSLVSPLGMLWAPEEQLAVARARNPGLDMSEAARMARARAQGKTLEVYHGTRSPRHYTEMRPAVNPEKEFGIHAADRTTAEEFANPGAPNARILELLANPGGIYETADVGSFKTPASWINALRTQENAWRPPVGEAGYPALAEVDPFVAAHYPRITDPATHQAILDLAQQYYPRTDLWGNPLPGTVLQAGYNYVHFQEALRNLLLRQGYPTLKYPNFVEGGGRPSYLFTDPRQLRSRYAAFNPDKLGSAHLLDSILAAIGLGAGAAAGATGRAPETPRSRAQ